AVSAAGLLALLWLWRKQRRPMTMPATFILLTVVVSSFMLTPLSSLLWQYFPLLDFTQFPWRFLSVQAFGGALATGALAMALPRPKYWLLPLIGLLLFSSLGRLKPDYLPLTDAEITAESLAQYEWFTGNIGTTISFEYLPPTVQPRPYTSGWLNSGNRWWVQPLSGELLSAELTNQRSSRQEWLLETAASAGSGQAVPSTLIFPTLYWPGWAAWIDGEQVEIRPSAGSGLIQLEVPAGRHEVVLRLMRTPVRLVAEWVSLTAVLLTIWLLVNRKERGERKENAGKNFASSAGYQPPFAVKKMQRRWLVLAGIALLAIGLRLWPSPTPPNNLRTWDFVQMGFLHPDVTGIPASSGAVLRGVTLSQTVIQPGESVQVMLQWDVPPAEDVTLALFSPAINWATDPNLPPPAALVQQTLPGDTAQMKFELHLAANAPTGLFVPRLTLANGRFLTPAGNSRDPLFLQPIRIVKVNNILVEVEQLTVRTVAVQQSAPDRLDVQLAWLTPQPLSQNYNVALRLTDAQGRFLRLVDVPPGYGFLPSSGWPTGQWVDDWLTIPLPPVAEGHALPFALVAQLYDVTEPNTAVLTRRLGELVAGENGLQFRPTEPKYELPEGIVLETAVFGDQIELQGYQLEQTKETLDLTLVWQAMQNGQTDYTRFVHLIAADAGGVPLAQVDSPPRYGSYPTSQWAAEEVVEDGVQLDLKGVPPGRYQLAVGFYQQTASQEFVQLPVFNKVGELLADGRFVLPITITIAP
ncbi:hypothetical protein MNBD_CHLOROFLEXI01-3706, partial [hydrothermal vent metagenome]